MSLSEKQKKELRQFVKDRNEALFSFDEKKIKEYMRKYYVPVPMDEAAFWCGVAKAILHINNAPEEAKDRARLILDLHNINSDIY